MRAHVSYDAQEYAPRFAIGSAVASSRTTPKREARPLAIALPDVYVQCAACDVPIMGPATAIPARLSKEKGFRRRKGEKRDIALHDICHVIWHREAAR